ncbi:MAG: Uma2 family endonuclease, partial [Singulisphaera sp.]
MDGSRQGVSGRNTGLSGRAQRALQSVRKAAQDWYGLPELRCTFSGRSIVPDVVFLLKEHIELNEHGEVVDETRLTPDIHVEIISPEQTVRTSHEKLIHATSHGTALGWLIHPYRETVDVYRPGGPTEERG